MRKYMRTVLALALLGAVGACMDLDVLNENNPDIERALQDPADVEQVIASAFLIWTTPSGSTDITMVLPALADEITNTRLQRTFQWSQEPRLPLPNDPLDDPVWIPRVFWDNYPECIANTNDGLRQIKAGMRIETLSPGASEVSDNTDRAYTYAKLMQGLCQGYLALVIDKGVVATEDTIVPAGYDDQLIWEEQHWTPYNEAMPIAIHSLEQAIERVENGEPFTTPNTWQNQESYTNEQVAQVAHTMIARLLIYNARTPEERAAVDWQKVLFHTERGLTFDWGLTLQRGIVTRNNWLRCLQRTDSNSCRSRGDMRMLGPADNSGNYQDWLAKPLGERDQFEITTPDRRITGENPDDDGAYFRYSASTSGLTDALGRYNFSYYQWWRLENDTGCGRGDCSFYALATEDENNLLRAEALLRTGDLQGAADLINITRTRGVKIGSTEYATNLPPVTAAGVPEVDGMCVPRKESGECGDLMDALMWERAIELYGQDPTRAWLDRRGFGQLLEGTLVHMPIPGRYLVSHGLPVYTFGGVGGDGAAR